MIFLWSCFSEQAAESWILNGEDLRGWVAAQGRLGTVFIESEHVVTKGAVPAEVAREEGVTQVFFELSTGGGPAQAFLKIEGLEARLPLGARAGEFDLVGNIEKRELSETDKSFDLEVILKRIEQESSHWESGHFILYDGEDIVGELGLNEQPSVSLFSSIWLTPEPQEPTIMSEGGDLLVELSVEPSLQGETALLRVNIPLREVVVPTSLIPSSLDRRFQLRPGTLSEEQRSELKQASIELSNTQEKDWLSQAAPVLLASVDEHCEQFLKPNLLELWLGYSVKAERAYIESAEENSKPVCRISFEPNPPQHRRRFKGHFDHNGIEAHIELN